MMRIFAGESQTAEGRVETRVILSNIHLLKINCPTFRGVGQNHSRNNGKRKVTLNFLIDCSSFA